MSGFALELVHDGTVTPHKGKIDAQCLVSNLREGSREHAHVAVRGGLDAWRDLAACVVQHPVAQTHVFAWEHRRHEVSRC